MRTRNRKMRRVARTGALLGGGEQSGVTATERGRGRRMTIWRAMQNKKRLERRAESMAARKAASERRGEQG